MKLVLYALLLIAPNIQAAAPVIKEAKVVTGSYIELDWQGMDYISNAGRSKENTTTSVNNFEVKLGNTVINQNFP